MIHGRLRAQGGFLVSAVMADNGVHVHMVSTVVGHKRGRWDQDGWTAPDVFCYDTMDVCMRRILEVDPDAWFMPMAFLGTPVWWAAENRDELAWCKNAAGEV